jgi:uncharacterized RDD family membrane protein YckC
MGTGVVEQSTPQQFCTECGTPHAVEDLVKFGDAAVCADCKPLFVQRMREGTAGPIGAVVYGGFWRRFLAQLVDSAVMLYMLAPALILIVAGVLLATRKTELGPAGSAPAMTAAFLLFTLIALIAPVFYIAYFTKNGGSTPGKMLLGLKIVTASGGPVGTGRAIGRVFARALSSAIFYIGDIMAGFDSQKRALHDRICDTRVIRIEPTVFGRRIGAFALDSLFCGIVGFVLLFGWTLWHGTPFLVTTVNPNAAGAVALQRYLQTWQPTVATWLFQMLYSVYFTSQKGATPGKMLAGLTVVTTQGIASASGEPLAVFCPMPS